MMPEDYDYNQVWVISEKLEWKMMPDDYDYNQVWVILF